MFHPDPGPVNPSENEPATAARLTRTEARLLHALRAQPGRAFTRSELLTLVTPDAIVLERTVDVHVRSLRRKLGTLAHRLETVRGVGYRWREDATGRGEAEPERRH
jgi:two-component system phosphate regulon response regulator PhoB